ncbi:VIT and VWA domain-containing protein [Teredinibacter sp. KSP-S5-2]|uniref:VIT and vWA domain-containing protein n=1 Tax=Teredinibacter sp. KSP-S5-2 TaxID=3034506 RepID=UPI0029346130|nr:VIT and VWA domain-containing protein [Teredinibacter sp. KSP-S5-2]WNO08627.1 VIT and VWA domain-containing protein [Teredinibacter sp. KSP-S5-2]
MRIILILLLVTCHYAVAQPYYAQTQTGRSAAKTEAPYFDTGDNDTTLSLLKTTTEISIDSVIADIRIKQAYQNDGSSPLEAVYTFPGSTKAAVYGLTIKIEDRIIEAKVEEKGKARAIYEEAKHQGKSAALLEQHKPNVFTTNVANILPGETIEVELRYTELLDINDNIYQLTYPLNFDAHNPNGRRLPPGSSKINVHLNTAVPVHSIISPTHPIEVIPSSSTSANIFVKAEDVNRSNEFVLRYQVSGPTIQTGLQLLKGEQENYFLLQIEPPARVEESMVPNREYIFVIDTSGSMNGFPIDVSKTLIVELLQSLRSWEKFNVVFFAGNTKTLSPTSLEASAENINNVVSMLENIDGYGGTDLLSALKSVAKIPLSPGYSRNVIAITDGYVSVEAETYKFINAHLENSNYFAFGIGGGVNHQLIDIIARAGYGEAYVALNKKEAKKHGRRMINAIRYPVLSQIDIDFDEFEAYDVQPIVLPDLFSNKPITVAGKWRGKAKGSVKVSGLNGFGLWKKNIPLTSASKADSRALEYIWARKEIEQLQDLHHLGYKQDSFQSYITHLGIKHNLLTNFTSFVAVDNQIRASSPEPQYLSGNGFAIPTLSLEISSHIPAAKQSSQETALQRGLFKFQRINNEWVDENHSASIPVIDISYDSPIYKKIIALFPELSNFDKKDIFYINLTNITLKITQKSKPISEEMIEKINLKLASYE